MTVAHRAWVRLFDEQTTVACFLVMPLQSHHHHPGLVETEVLQGVVVFRTSIGIRRRVDPVYVFDRPEMTAEPPQGTDVQTGLCGCMAWSRLQRVWAMIA